MSPIAPSMPLEHAAHVSHEARPVKSLACDAIEDGAHEVKRAVSESMQRGIERLEDIKDEGVHYVKRRPLKAIAMAAGVGLMGIPAAWITGRFGPVAGFFQPLDESERRDVRQPTPARLVP